MHLLPYTGISIIKNPDYSCLHEIDVLIFFKCLSNWAKK